jgi:Lrp/AsnC family leucine-responsive transcriptional regulator
MSNSPAASVDGFDRKILAIVQRSNRITSDHIGEQVGLSPAAVQRRIKRMREQNIIQADVAVVNAKAVGRGVTLIVQVTLERERTDLLDMFKKDMKANPSVQQCYYVNRSSYLILVVTATHMEHYEAFTRSVFFGDRNIRHFSTNVVMDSVKVELSVPVILEED